MHDSCARETQHNSCTDGDWKARPVSLAVCPAGRISRCLCPQNPKMDFMRILSGSTLRQTITAVAAAAAFLVIPSAALCDPADGATSASSSAAAVVSDQPTTKSATQTAAEYWLNNTVARMEQLASEEPPADAA